VTVSNQTSKRKKERKKALKGMQKGRGRVGQFGTRQHAPPLQVKKERKMPVRAGTS